MGDTSMPKESTSTSETGDQWVSLLVNEARNRHSLVADGVFDRIELLLKEEISEKDLTPPNLKRIAIQLLGAMVPPLLEPEETP